jgi:hypothetical protein
MKSVKVPSRIFDQVIERGNRIYIFGLVTVIVAGLQSYAIGKSWILIATNWPVYIVAAFVMSIEREGRK